MFNAQLDKTQYSKEEVLPILMEIRRLENHPAKERSICKTYKIINFIEDESIDIERFRHNQNFAFVLGNGVSRGFVEPRRIKNLRDPIYGCNALYRTFRPTICCSRCKNGSGNKQICFPK